MAPLRQVHAPSLELRLRRWLHPRERLLAWAWLAGAAALLALAAGWAVLTRGAERSVEDAAARWVARLDAAQALALAGRHAEAAERLEQLERRFPARFVKHRMDRERERLLGLLGASHAALDRKGRALDAFERRAEFDPRNVESHVLLAQACERFAELDRAIASYEAALAIHPTHLPAVEALVGLHHDAARFADVVATFERYLDAFLLARLRLVVDGVELPLEVLADGLPHAVELPLALPEGWSGELALATRGYSVRIGRVELAPPLRAGLPGRAGTQVLSAEGWTPQGADEVRPGAFSARAPDSRLTRRVELPHGAARARVEIAVFKALPPELWRKAEVAYRNRVDPLGLELARARTLAGGCLEAGTLFLH